MHFERLIELIVLLLQELKNDNQLDKKDVDRLSMLGYTQNEISTAFSWLYTRFHQGEKIFSEERQSNQSHRFLNEVEKNIIVSDAFGYLVQLSELGLINEFDVEEIIDSIMVSGQTRVQLTEMKMFVASHLLDIDDMNKLNRRIIINEDTIN
jgi:uncharacterized protein Smg (DUF494 family)